MKMGNLYDRLKFVATLLRALAALDIVALSSLAVAAIVFDNSGLGGALFIVGIVTGFLLYLAGELILLFVDIAQSSTRTASALEKLSQRRKK